MSIWRRLQRGLTDLRDRTPRDRDTADEVAHYRDALVAEGLARGLTLEAAKRAAQIELGGETQLRETVRSLGWERPVASILEDLQKWLRFFGQRKGGRYVGSRGITPPPEVGTAGRAG